MALILRTTQTVRTRLVEKGPQFTTVVTFDWSGLTEPQLQAIAQKQLVVNPVQSKFRRDGVVPATYTLKVADFANGVHAPEPVTVDTTLARINALPESERAKLMEALGLKPSAPVARK